MLSEKHITSFLHQRGATALMMAVACFCCLFAWQRGSVAPIVGNLGWGLPSANLWFSFGPVSAVMNLAVSLTVALLTVYINRAFNVLRSLTSLVATMFLAMQVALPSLLGQFYGGSMLVLTVMLCVGTLFSVYSDNRGQRSVFLIFCLLGAEALTQIACLLYVPVFLLGCVQMRIFGMRTFLASLLGLITPAWIVLGFGIVEPQTLLQTPQTSFLTPAWSMFDSADMVQALVTTGITIVLGIIFVVANLLKILSYNSRVRAFNGFLTLLFCATAIFALLNFNNFTFYIPLLNVLVAYQIAHFFTYRRQRRTYIPLLLIMAGYIALYVWGI